MRSQGGFLISQIKHISERVWDRMLKEYGIDVFNGAQGKLLYVLWEHDGISAAELAKKAGLKPTTLTTMLDRMERADLLKRTPHETDRRAMRLCLTEKGKALQKMSEYPSDRITEVYYAGFTNEEVEQFESYLLRVLRNLQNEEENGNLISNQNSNGKES